MKWKALCRLALCLMLMAPAASMAQPTAPAAPVSNLEAALALPLASGLTGAENAEVFAWIEYEAGRRNIWVAEAGGAARQLTRFEEDDGRPLYGLTLSPDGSRILYVRGGDGDFPDSAPPNAAADPAVPKQEIFLLPTAGGEPALIGEGHSPVFSPDGSRIAFTRRGEIWLWEQGALRRLGATRGQVRRLTFSPDGSRLLFIDDRGDYSFIGLMDVGSGALRHFGAGLGMAVEPIFSPDGRSIAFISYVEPPLGADPASGSYWSIHVAEAAGGEARRIWTAPDGRGGRYAGTRSRNLFWSADGDLVFPWERSGWLHAYAIDAARGGAPRALTAGEYELETFLLSPDRQSLVFASNQGDIDRRHIWRRPLKGGTAAQLTRGPGIQSYPAFAGERLAAIATDADSPAYPVLVDGMRPLGRMARLRGAVTPEAVTFRASDGQDVRGQLFRSRLPGKRPALIFVHGGPRRQMLLGYHPSAYYSNAYALNQHFAAQGYHVLTVNYRSGTGYGLAFRDSPEIGRQGGSEYRDIAGAGRWLASRGDVDPERIGIWGGSWGGYLAALALARDSDLFAAGVDFHGVHSLLRRVPDSMSPEAQEAARRLQWQASPMAALDSWRSPVLLIHGDDDRNVDFSQSVMLARELAARGIPHEQLVFPNERHSFLRHSSWLASYRATEDFLERHIMNKESGR